jgi:opacity protein-like surface antigen
MRKTLLLFVIALACAPVSFAQSRDYSFYEFYVGYAYERADNGADRLESGATAVVNGVNVARVNFQPQNTSGNGFLVEFNQNVHRNVGIVTSLSGTYDTVNYFDSITGHTFRAKLQRYDLLAGPRFNARLNYVTPFAHALFGVSHVRASFDEVFNTSHKTDTAFAMAFGGGVDLAAGEHIDVRAAQVDYIPTFFNGGRQDNFRFSAGVKIK